MDTYILQCRRGNTLLRTFRLTSPGDGAAVNLAGSEVQFLYETTAGSRMRSLAAGTLSLPEGAAAGKVTVFFTTAEIAELKTGRGSAFELERRVAGVGGVPGEEKTYVAGFFEVIEGISRNG